VQVAGSRWGQPGAQAGLGLVGEGLSGPHRQYLADGGSGFLLGDGRLSYGPEQIVEAYYRLQRIWPEDPGPVRWQFGPDIQFIRNPGYNRARGPVSLWAIRLHVQY
jgi:high affinity Mn2+ porin